MLTNSEIEHIFELSKDDRMVIVGSEIRQLCAQARLANDAPPALPDATVESIMRQVDIVVENTQKLTEAGLNVQFAQGAYDELARQITDALRAHRGK